MSPRTRGWRASCSSRASKNLWPGISTQPPGEIIDQCHWTPLGSLASRSQASLRQHDPPAESSSAHSINSLNESSQLELNWILIFDLMRNFIFKLTEWWNEIKNRPLQHQQKWNQLRSAVGFFFLFFLFFRLYPLCVSVCVCVCVCVSSDAGDAGDRSRSLSLSLCLSFRLSLSLSHSLSLSFSLCPSSTTSTSSTSSAPAPLPPPPPPPPQLLLQLYSR